MSDKEIGAIQADIKTLQSEVIDLRRVYKHGLSNDVNNIKGRMEVMEENHGCIQQEKLGKIEEFMENTKGFRITLMTLATAMILQIGTFIYLWASLTNTVNKNTDHLWKTVTPETTGNTRNIDKILAKFELIQVIQGMTGNQGNRGIQGIQGEPGKDR